MDTPRLTDGTFDTDLELSMASVVLLANANDEVERVDEFQVYVALTVPVLVPTVVSVPDEICGDHILLPDPVSIVDEVSGGQAYVWLRVPLMFEEFESAVKILVVS